MKKLLFVILLFEMSSVSFAQIAITEVFYDTPYFEDMNSRQQNIFPFSIDIHHLGEYIELYNYTTEDIPMKGWSLSDRVTRFVFPANTIIKSGKFLIVAYKLPNSNVTFPEMFPNTIGKESQIIYQSTIFLNNDREYLRINMGTLRGVNFSNTEVNHFWWDKNSQVTTLSNGIDDSCIIPANCNFYRESLHLSATGTSISVATPLTANYVPPLQNLEDIQIVKDAIIANLGNSTWDFYSDAIINNTCPENISLVEQNPSETYLATGKCFTYDASGNNTTSLNCTPPSNTPNTTNEYTPEQINDISSKITVAPNPTNGAITISWDATIVGKISTIQITSSNGVSLSVNPINPSQADILLSLIGQPTGIYIVRFILNTSQIITKNVIKI